MAVSADLKTPDFCLYSLKLQQNLFESLSPRRQGFIRGVVAIPFAIGMASTAVLSLLVFVIESIARAALHLVLAIFCVDDRSFNMVGYFTVLSFINAGLYIASVVFFVVLNVLILYNLYKSIPIGIPLPTAPL